MAKFTENFVQTSLMAAIEVHCDRSGLKHTSLQVPPPAQSASMNKFIADFCFTINNSKFFIIEAKVLDIPSKEFQSFDELQWKANCVFEKIPTPIFYMYNIVDKDNISYFKPNRKRNWPTEVCHQHKFSKPSALPGKKPDIDNHKDVFELFNSDMNVWNPHDIGWAFTAINKNIIETNGLIVFIYGATAKKEGGKFILQSGEDLEINKLIKLMKIIESKPNYLKKEDKSIISDFVSGCAAAEKFFNEKGYPEFYKPKGNKKEPKI